MAKNVVVVSDLHCGSVVGLTSPGWERGDYANEQVALWEAYTKIIDRFKKVFGEVDICICNGDALDGKSSRWGGTDTIEPRILRQIDMATEALDYIKAKNYVFTRGTPYHVGVEEDYEDSLAKNLGGRIKDHAYLDIERVTFSVKHRVGSSTIPHGRQTAIARERLWDFLWAEEKEQHERSQIILRSHVHYFAFAGGDNWLGLTTPALQGLGSKFGARMCSGTVDFGIVYFIIDSGTFQWGHDIVLVEEQKDKIIRF